MGNIMMRFFTSSQQQQEQEVAPPAESLSAPSIMEGRRVKSSNETWLRKCSHVQRANASPEVLAKAKEKAERSLRLSKVAKKASKLQKSNIMCQRSWNTSVKEMAVTKSAPAISMAERSERMRHSSALAKTRMETVQRIAQESQSDDEEGEATLDLMGAEMGVQALVPVEALEEEGQMEMQQLLEQLREEPAEDAEVTAKFELFEEYMKTVEKMRDETFAFWDEAKADFHATAVTDITRKLRTIDSHENLGVEFHPGRWFVYDMTHKAGQNSGMIGSILAMIKSRVELLARTEDCPICMEELHACGQEPHVLSCCHKVCGECWSHWAELQGERAFCPLCRNEEFLGDLMRRASTLAPEVGA